MLYRNLGPGPPWDFLICLNLAPFDLQAPLGHCLGLPSTVSSFPVVFFLCALHFVLVFFCFVIIICALFFFGCSKFFTYPSIIAF